MLRKLILAIIIFTTLSEVGHSQTLDSITGKLFFMINTNGGATELLQHFNSLKELSPIKDDSSLIVYNPDTSQAWSNYSYVFSDHPYFKTKFKCGKISLEILKVKKIEHIIDVMLHLQFESKKTFDSEYLKVKNLLLEWDTKPNKQRETQSTFEVVEFRKKSSEKSITLTQTRDQGVYYLILTLNSHQL